jgi:glycine cleavage system pyridoxal-binding protein P
VDKSCHPQNIALIQTRGEALGLEVVVGDVSSIPDLTSKAYCGVAVQYPGTEGRASFKVSTRFDLTWSCGAVWQGSFKIGRLLQIYVTRTTRW